MHPRPPLLNIERRRAVAQTRAEYRKTRGFVVVLSGKRRLKKIFSHELISNKKRVHPKKIAPDKLVSSLPPECFEYLEASAKIYCAIPRSQRLILASPVNAGRHGGIVFYNDDFRLNRLNRLPHMERVLIDVKAQEVAVLRSTSRSEERVNVLSGHEILHKADSFRCASRCD